jgi:hypothetical protein
MASTLSPGEEAQLAQTIEMFEVITQSQPHDYQSLEILKEAYAKLGRDKEAVGTAKRIAKAYVEMGQLSSAILEYETILQQCPEDTDVQNALNQIESGAKNFPTEAASIETTLLPKAAATNGASIKSPEPVSTAPLEDGRRNMHKIFVESRLVTTADFDLYWASQSTGTSAGSVVEPFIQRLADKGIVPLEKSLKILSDKSRCAYLPLNSYDIDIDLARTFPVATCRRWCVLPFDRMSKSILVATANPFNMQAGKELSSATPNRLLWYLVSPPDLVKNLRKVFR